MPDSEGVGRENASCISCGPSHNFFSLVGCCPFPSAMTEKRKKVKYHVLLELDNDVGVVGCDGGA